MTTVASECSRPWAFNHSYIFAFLKIEYHKFQHTCSLALLRCCVVAVSRCRGVVVLRAWAVAVSWLAVSWLAVLQFCVPVLRDARAFVSIPFFGLAFLSCFAFAKRNNAPGPPCSSILTLTWFEANALSHQIDFQFLDTPVSACESFNNIMLFSGSVVLHTKCSAVAILDYHLLFSVYYSRRPW